MQRPLSARVFRQARALFVLFHLLAVGILSFPAPVGAMNRAAFEHPATQAAFDEYAALLRSLGVEMDRERLSAILWEGGTRVLAVREVLVAPFQPYAEAVGARQGWRMFHAVHRDPSWLVVELREERGWRVIYEARSATATWRRHQLDQERLRALTSVWSWREGRSSYRAFGAWLARRAAEDFPDALGLRIALLQRPIPTPAQRRRGELAVPRRHWAEVHDLRRAP